MNMIKDLWATWKGWKSPVLESPALPLPLPAISQEQFSQEENYDLRVASLYRRVVATNNAHVTRDYGSGPVDETLASKYQDKTMDDAAHQELSELGFGIPTFVNDDAAKKRARRMVLKQYQMELPLMPATTYVLETVMDETGTPIPKVETK